jgi:outer membrane protein OmpA-like peptidoglycan-associated protein
MHARVRVAWAVAFACMRLFGSCTDVLSSSVLPLPGPSEMRQRVHDNLMDGLRQWLTEQLIVDISKDTSSGTVTALKSTIPKVVNEALPETLVQNLREPIHQALTRSLGHAVGLTLSYTLRDVGRQEPVCYYCEFIDVSYCKLCYRSRNYKYQKYEDLYAMDYWVAMYSDHWIAHYAALDPPEPPPPEVAPEPPAEAPPDAPADAPPADDPPSEQPPPEEPAAPEPEPQPETPPSLEGINFDFDKDTLTQASLAILDRAVDVLKKRTSGSVSVEGHTDSKGKDAYNQALSERRANAVKKYLVDHGVTQVPLTAVGFGESQPIDTNDTWHGRARNRRVELKFV